MKNWKFLVLVLGFMICLAWQQKAKTYSVNLPLEKWSNYLQGIEYTKQQLRQSDLPSKQVALITDSVLTPMQVEITTQVQQLMKAEQIKQDTTKPKPKKK